MTLISIFGKDVEEARKALKSKILLSIVLACVFFGERGVAHAAYGVRFAQSWGETLLATDAWQANATDRKFLTEKLAEYETYVATDRTYWLNSGLVSAPWPLAQDVMADPAGALTERDAILALIKANTREGCVCWSETGVRQHMGASAWVTTALVVLGGDQRDTALDDLISRQAPSGAWAIFPDASKDPRSGSTYATATSLMAIVTHRDAGLLSGERRKKAEAALDKGSRWLMRNYNFTQKGWMDYPNDPAGRAQFLGLTAQTLWTLHQILPTSQLKRVDATFIERDDLDPDMKDFDMSDVGIYFGTASFDFDTTRYARQPWALLAMQAGYKNYSIKQRVKMRLMMANAINEKSWDDRESEREYMLLELLIAYRNLTKIEGGTSS